MSSWEKRQLTPANRIKDNLEESWQDSDTSKSETYGGDEWASTVQRTSLIYLYHELKN